ARVLREAGVDVALALGHGPEVVLGGVKRALVYAQVAVVHARVAGLDAVRVALKGGLGGAPAAQVEDARAFHRQLGAALAAHHGLQAGLVAARKGERGGVRKAGPAPQRPNAGGAGIGAVHGVVAGARQRANQEARPVGALPLIAIVHERSGKARVAAHVGRGLAVARVGLSDGFAISHQVAIHQLLGGGNGADELALGARN
nr:hypothetical protein [Tanacetum cinerariifolium]